jgi:glycerol-3-phosphate dehydrogenase
MQRYEIIDAYRENPNVSVLIVGAGINGTGTFFDLALQGIDVLMVDKADFCSGASAASSRLVHGGIRYLEHGAFRLVRESLVERNRLLKNAPHAVSPIAFTVPVFNRLSGILNAPLKFIGLLKKPNERGWLVIKLGMMFYDWVTRNNRMTPTHRMLSRDAALSQHKRLSPEIIGAGTYYDAIMPYAERIGVEIALDAEAENAQARALNYVSFAGAAGDTVSLRDEVSGETFDVKPKVVINAAGAWIDLVNHAMQHDSQFIGGTKGSHIVIDYPELWETLNGSALYFENKDGRMCIVLPLGDKAIVGATDIRIDDPDAAVCSDEEIDYFIGFTAHVLPEIKIDRSHIVFHFSGVRPLPHNDAEFTGLVTREHSIETLEPNSDHRFPVYSLIGGKWTTFRAFAEEATDKTLAHLGQTRRASTEDIPIGGGGIDYPHEEHERRQWLEQVAAQTGLARPQLETLFERYGTRAEAVAQYIAAGDDKPLGSAPGYSHREIMFVTENEKVVHLDDLLVRRSLLAMLGLVDAGVLRQVGEAAGAVLGWSDEQIQQEIDRAVDILVSRNGVPPDRLRPA